ncbi:hypothetical protein [Actinoplanes derwentensis]|uniref:Uncharacterized protein n=1 Tax=Actinoplanes derwentensis TaxID=113562 RepID=A0A1H2C831_9ACTN|nr:hypothetical protein [Actinoplanes derwentensis]GID86533.1 hypothetical protein Ade03nite_54570 [Actinoplanes derwentensis]SDT66593.1 hypothetical protein SAMN04489716_5367 [Actinoplanes derwentensis]
MRSSRQQKPDSTPSPQRPADADLPIPVAGLCDLVLVRTADGGLARPDAPETALNAGQLTDYAQASAVAGRDLRVLVDDGAGYAALLGPVADSLSCDIIVTPVGASVKLLVTPGGRRGEAMPVDRVSGDVVEWALVQPAAVATTLPGWFDLAGGLVLHRPGLATLPLPGGLEFANREDFVVRRAAVAQLGTGHPDLVTVALATRDGGFRLSAYLLDPAGRAPGRYSGRDVAAALSSIHLYGGDLRLWLRWPDNESECRQLVAEVTALAEATGATVWAPEPGGEAVLLRGCRDLAARDRSGAITGWREFRPPGAPETYRFVTDRDGRLVPREGPEVLTTDGVALISTGRLPEAALRERYSDLSAETGTVLLDLAVLDDGRVALRYGDGSHLAVSTAELRGLLEGSGWAGEDLLLLTPVPPDRAVGMRDHLTLLERELGVEVWCLPPGATVVVRDGLARAVDDRRQPTRWLRAGSVESARWRNDDGWLVPRQRHTPAPMPAAPAPAPAVAAAPPPERMPTPSGPPATVPARGDRPHGIGWLPAVPEVNAEPLQLWLACPWPPQRVPVEGVPAANLFLIGALDGERVARANPAKYLLSLRVEAGGAVDLGRVTGVPADLGPQVSEPGTFLLPAGWLNQARLRAGWRIGADGRPHEHTDLPADPVVLRCTGARHGADGLPDEAVHWPRGERGGGAWAVLPETPAPTAGDSLPLLSRRPAVRPGSRLVHLRVEAHQAIDVPATAAAMAGLTSVRSRVPDLVADGVTLLLPKQAWDRTRVDQVLYADDGKWRQRSKGIDLPLSSLLAPERG